MAFIAIPEKLAYYPVPKCACTSLKAVMLYLQTNDPSYLSLDEVGSSRVHKSIPSTRFISANQDRFHALNRFCVVRSPVKRILSCYSNRVLHHRDITKANMRKFNVSNTPVNPTLEEFILNLDAYQKIPIILHHSRPLSYYLGVRPSYFHQIFGMHQITELESYISDVAECSVVLPRMQTGGPKIDPTELSKQASKRIEEIFCEDIDIYGSFF